MEAPSPNSPSTYRQSPILSGGRVGHGALVSGQLGRPVGTGAYQPVEGIPGRIHIEPHRPGSAYRLLGPRTDFEGCSAASLTILWICTTRSSCSRPARDRWISSPGSVRWRRCRSQERLWGGGQGAGELGQCLRLTQYAQSRQSMARCAGLRPPILPSTGTILSDTPPRAMACSPRAPASPGVWL